MKHCLRNVPAILNRSCNIKEKMTSWKTVGTRVNTLMTVCCIGLACCVSTPIYALAPIEDDASSQEAQVNSSPLTASTSQDTSSLASAADADNTPLIGSSSVATTTPTLQNSTIGSPDPTLSTLPMSARVARLEQQMGNMVHANLSDQIMNLQQQVQQLSGELQVQQHDITLLNQQLRTFYQDLSTQIKQIKNLSVNSTSEDNNAALPATPPVASTMGAVIAPKVKPAVAATTTPAVTAQASTAYKAALNFLTKKQYALAAKGFSDYIKNYPTGNFVVNAHYWLGEINVVQHNLDKAISEFNTVITQFPHSSQVPDAKVKLAIIHASQGHVPQARAEFMKIKQQYPGTTAAQLADIQLQQLGTQ